jgi:hypothetical protein
LFEHTGESGTVDTERQVADEDFEFRSGCNFFVGGIFIYGAVFVRGSDESAEGEVGI